LLKAGIELDPNPTTTVTFLGPKALAAPKKRKQKKTS
jgi:hypothetical protein